MSIASVPMTQILKAVGLGSLSVLAAIGQTASQGALRMAPIPADPLELATGPIESLTSPTSRAAALQLLSRARDQFALRSTRQAYLLKVSFTVDSAGRTNYDGSWQMEDSFAPKLGHRWTATAASGYTVASVAANGQVWGDASSSAVPLRLLEARGVLFDPLPSPAFADQGSIRTSTATFHGATLTCLLLSRSRNATRTAGRDWEESEECIDPQSGLLQVHSEVPGRYALFDYANAPEFGGHVLPRNVTVTEAGRTVTQVKVESLDTLNGPDPAVFAPTEEMKARGPAVAMTSATKITRVHGQNLSNSPATVRTVCVFGMVTSTGHMVEAHALQPADPNSQAAVEDALKIDFAPMTPAGTGPRQHFAFVIEKFVTPE